MNTVVKKNYLKKLMEPKNLRIVALVIMGLYLSKSILGFSVVLGCLFFLLIKLSIRSLKNKLSK